MSAIRLTYLYCDGEQCPRLDDSEQQPFKIDPLSYESGKVQRQQAREAGWTFSKGKDYCALCSKQRHDIGGKA